MSTPPTVPPGTTTVIIEPARVLDLLDIVDDIAEQFEAKLDGDLPPYLLEWGRFDSKVRRDLKKKGASWQDTVKRLHGNPTTWHDYVAEVLRLVPPVHPVLKIQKKNTRQVTLLRHDITDAIHGAQMTSHHTFMSTDDDKSDSIVPSSLGKDLREQTHWENSINDLKSDMDKKLHEMMKMISERTQ